MNATAESPRWCVLIPCLNEARAIASVVRSVLAIGAPVIVVDDGSDDGTPDIAAGLPVTLIRHAQRRGKGEALRSGFRRALAEGFDAVLTMDGDGQHSADDIPRLLAAATLFPHHIITGARVINRERQPTYRRLANNFGDWGISWACGQRLIDTQSGQRYYPREVVELVDIEAQGFVFESDILIEAAWQRGVRVASVAIESRYESSRAAGHGQYRLSHFRPVADFLGITSHVVWKVIRAGGLWENGRRVRRQQPLLIEEPQLATFIPSLAD
ncbi:MAG TPA: glycosyltransferase family 2 protein [Rhodanobacteraceae bacterium]|nr:glycosyltransferase family 2 protein [Rhodanobacteraceae bacterium]